MEWNSFKNFLNSFKARTFLLIFNNISFGKGADVVLRNSLTPLTTDAE
jgi:hypothetical protein